MPIGSGLSAQCGMAAETTYGTPVTVDRFLDIEEASVRTIVGKGETPTLGSRYLRASQVATFVKGAEGDITLPVMTKGMGLMFEQMFGQVVSAQVGATAEYTHTFTDDPLGLAGTSATVQLGKPATTGVVYPFTYAGGKITEWELELEVDGVLKLTTTWLFADADTTETLATVSYLTGRNQFAWDDAEITWGGASVCAKEFKVAAKHALADDRYCIGSTVRREPLLNGMSELTIEGTGEFESLDFYNDFVSGTQKQLVFRVRKGQIPTTTVPYMIEITIPVAELVDPGEPEISGPEILEQPLNFRALDGGTLPVISLVYHTDDAAP